MQLNLSLPTVVQNLHELSEDGLICEAGQQTKTGGRRAKTYTSVNDFRTAIGLDVTPHHASAVAVDLCGHILARRCPLSARRTITAKWGGWWTTWSSMPG